MAELSQGLGLRDVLAPQPGVDGGCKLPGRQSGGQLRDADVPLK